MSVNTLSKFYIARLTIIQTISEKKHQQWLTPEFEPYLSDAWGSESLWCGLLHVSSKKTMIFAIANLHGWFNNVYQ